MHKKAAMGAWVALAIAGALSVPASVNAQVSTQGNKLSHARPVRQAAHANASAEAATTAASDGTTYLYTLVSYPGTLNTLGVGINPGAFHRPNEAAPLQIVGAEVFPDFSSQTGFGAEVAQTTSGTTEAYRLINDAQIPTPQQTYSINDLGQTVGDYIDANGDFHSYYLDCGKFTVFNVPFKGATGTASPAINNAGEIVGAWFDSSGNAHNYTLIDGKFASFDVPGAAQAEIYYGINSAGDITGSFADAAGTTHAFLRKGSKYTTIDFPGAVYTAASGINDSDVVVGGYCLTVTCTESGEGELGFLWKDGVFTTLTIPGEFEVGLASINNDGVILGNYLDADDTVYTFIATPQQ